MKHRNKSWLGTAGVVAGVAVLGGAARAQAACEAHSGPKTAALVELYTSEGCSSCPPADRLLSRLRDAVGRDAEVVPLSLHVDYWDGIGWKDSFAQARFDQRQSLLVRKSGRETVYTPQFFVAGRELRAWQTGLSDGVRQVNARAAAADIRIRAQATGAGSLAVHVDAHTAVDAAALYVSVTESGLVSRVTRGENRGVTLGHDHVVRSLYGPLPFGAGESVFLREVPLAPGWVRENVEVVAFVTDERSAQVLQALAASACTGT